MPVDQLRDRSERTRPSVPGLGFREPEEPEETTTPPAGTIPSPASPPAMESEDSAQGSADEWADETDESGNPAATSSRGSTRVANPIVGEGLRDTFRNGVIIASHQAHTHLVRTQGQLEAGLYLADTDDAAAIGDPLARITARREGLGEVNPDTADLLSALMGLAAYGSKQIQRNATAKKIDSRNAGIETPEDTLQ